MKLNIGISSFVKRQTPDSGKTYSKLTFQEIAHHAQEQINKNIYKKGYRDGVILIPVDKKYIKQYISPLIKINTNTKLVAIVKKRRINEENYISIKALNGTPLKLSGVDLILYRNDVLKETNENSTLLEWELIAFHGIPEGIKDLPMGPITMMRNQLQLPGGTKAKYTADQWAESTNFWQNYALLKNNNSLIK